MTTSGSTMKKVRETQPTVFKALDSLSKKHGAEVFRIIGQRYFNYQREQTALKAKIAAREKELRELQQKALR